MNCCKALKAHPFVCLKTYWRCDKKTGHTQTGQPHLSDDKLEDCRGWVWASYSPHQPHAYTFPCGLGVPREPACGILFYESFSHLTSATPRDTGCQHSVTARKRGAGMPPHHWADSVQTRPRNTRVWQSPPTLIKPSRREQIKLLHQRHIFSFLTMMTNFWFKVSSKWHLYPVW